MGTMGNGKNGERTSSISSMVLILNSGMLPWYLGTRNSQMGRFSRCHSLVRSHELIIYDPTRMRSRVRYCDH